MIKALAIGLLYAISVCHITPIHAASIPSPDAWPLPKAVAPPPAIAASRDVAYPGVVRLEVDVTDVARGIHRIHETVPVRGARRLTLLFPQWIIGDPVPPNALDQLAGLVVSAAGNTLKWQGDPGGPPAFHVEVAGGG